MSDKVQDQELTEFSYVKEVSLNAKGFMQISLKYRDKTPISNKEIAKDAKELKKELLTLIENTDNEELLSLLKEDLVFYGNTKYNDVTDRLNSKQLKELELLANEDDFKDTVTLEEFKKATEKWRSK